VELNVEVVDLIDIWAEARIVKITSNEGGAGDARIVGPLVAELRAEREGQGSGRVYQLEVEGFDRAGNTVRKTVEVVVPKSRSHRWGARGG
jgi:hypothetical protein